MDEIKFEKLLFIYNADSGIGNMVLDGLHKIISPNTYQCSLCDLTYGAFTEKSIWKKFREETDLHMIFLHKDEFQKEYAVNFKDGFTFPIILSFRDKILEVFIGTAELNTLKNAKELIEIIKSRSG